jgi:predicted membrane protein
MLEHFQDLQVRPQSQRLQILDLLNDLMLQHRQALKELGAEFIVGITDLVSGEKDPRNLMIIFSVLKAIMIEWDISNHAEVGQLTVFEDIMLIPYSLCSMLFSATSRSPSDHHRMIPIGSLLKT